MKEDLFRLISCSNGDSQSVVDELADKYNCSREKIYWTVRSIYGDKLRNLRWQFREPIREQFIKDVLQCKTVAELRERYNYISQDQWAGIFDRLLGVSTFSKAREFSISEMLPVMYNPTIDNNEAMIAACLIGDGSFDAKRRAFKIEHCAKQLGWLEKKASLFKKSYSQALTGISHYENRNTYAWYSGGILSGKFLQICLGPRVDAIKHLNEFGIWWLFLDDGCYCHTSQQIITFATTNMEMAHGLAEHLRRMGFVFRVANKNAIVMTGIENIIPFFKRFLEPFEKQTPDCVKYKTTYMKI